jgi:hypothetical protein
MAHLCDTSPSIPIAQDRDEHMCHFNQIINQDAVVIAAELGETTRAGSHRHQRLAMVQNQGDPGPAARVVLPRDDVKITGPQYLSEILHETGADTSCPFDLQQQIGGRAVHAPHDPKFGRTVEATTDDWPTQRQKLMEAESARRGVHSTEVDHPWVQGL